MPFSQLSYQDVGLIQSDNYFCDEVLETSQDSQRVVYEDPSVELAQRRRAAVPSETELPFEAESVSTTSKKLKNIQLN